VSGPTPNGRQSAAWEADLGDLNLPQELVTGEAVVLDLHPAAFLSRALAYLLDFVVLVVLQVAVVMTLTWLLASVDNALGGAIFLGTELMLLFGLPITVETLSRGRSLGKWAAGLRVVRVDGGPIRFRQAMVRGLMLLIDIYGSSGSVALVSSLLNARGQRLGDLVAGTYVVRERGGPALAPPPQMPPHLAYWASTADIARLPDRLSLAARQFLGRAPMLHPTSRDQIGRRLAQAVSASVAPPPPGHVHPEDFLAAVLTERRNRELSRMQRQEQQRLARLERRGSADVLAATSTRLIGED